MSAYCANTTFSHNNNVTVIHHSKWNRGAGCRGTGVCKRPKPVFAKNTARGMKGYSPLLWQQWRWCTNYTMRKLDMNNISIHISSIGIEATTALIASAYFIYLLFRNNDNIFFTSTSIGNCQNCFNINLVYFV